jgi:hypothetical protein
MKHIKSALVALALLATPVMAYAPAVAAGVDFSVSLGNAAFGYSDGYWDRDHKWHAWRNKDEAQYFRAHNAEHYTEAKHDKDRNDHDQGWRNDRYWDKH